jgi:2-oxoisovalerate dehydrogenase E1 component alpha subunit
MVLDPAAVAERGNVIRPGSRSRFDEVGVVPAGATRKPEAVVSAAGLSDLATGLVRVLDDAGQAVGPWDPGLDRNELVRGLRDMLVVRELDRRMLIAQRQGKSSFYMQCTGEEAIACGFRAEMSPGDMSVPTYRQQGLLVAAGYPLELMVAQVYSNQLDPLHGRQMPVFYSSKAHGFFSISGNLATQYVQAVGWAMASALRGTREVAAAWIGEGATAESDFHSGMVFASAYSPPVVLNIVNNQWAISTNQGIARGAAPTFAARGIGFGIPSVRVDGNDYLAVRAVSAWALERARSGRGPTLIEWVTYRAAAHSSSDDPAGYRSKDDGILWPLGDPVQRLRSHLRAATDWTDSDDAELTAGAELAVKDAQKAAEAHGVLRTEPGVSPSEMFRDVYATMPPHLRLQRQSLGY